MSFDIVIIAGVVFNLICMIGIVRLIRMKVKSDREILRLLDNVGRCIDQVIYLEKRRELLIRKIKELGDDPYSDDVDPSVDESS